jgi:hypothetical protein
MNILCWGLGIFCFAFMLHLVIWKMQLPKRQTRTLLIVFFGSFMVVMGACLILGVSRNIFPKNPYEYLQIILMYTPLTLAYIITYSALEADSPSLVMIRIIANAGPEGLLKSKFDELMTDDLLVFPRLGDLVRDGMALVEGNTYTITPKGSIFVKLFIFYRKLLKAPLGG